MKFLKSKSSTFFFLFFLTNVAYGIDKEALWSKLTFSDTPESIQESQSLAYSNPSLVEEILFIPDSERDNSVARENSLLVLSNCSLTGIITTDRFFNDAFRLLSQLNNYVHPTRLVDERKSIIAIVGNYSEKQTNPLTNLSSLLSILDSLFANGLLSNVGTLKSLRSKISNAQELWEKKTPNYKAAVANKIEAAINEAEAQRGKHLTEEAYLLFSTFCKNLIIQIQNTN